MFEAIESKLVAANWEREGTDLTINILSTLLERLSPVSQSVSPYPFLKV
jgi:hypothetical protein